MKNIDLMAIKMAKQRLDLIREQLVNQAVDESQSAVEPILEMLIEKKMKVLTSIAYSLIISSEQNIVWKTSYIDDELMIKIEGTYQ